MSRVLRALTVPLLALLIPTASRAGAAPQELVRADGPRSEVSRDTVDAVRLVFLDVGQGDATVIRSPEGKVALVDAGPEPDVLVRSLRALDVDTIDLAVASHPHADHIGGMGAVLRSFPVRFYMDNGAPHTTATYRELMATLASSEVVYLEATPRRVELGSATLRVLPLPAGPAENPNDRSVGLVVEHGAFRAFLSGDSERSELVHFVRTGIPDVTVLKAPHHGAADALSRAFLEAVSPEVVVVSAGRGNPYGHPHPRALRAYAEAARKIYRTDRDGRVTVAGYHDGSYEVTTAGTGEAGAGDVATLANSDGKVVIRHVY